jgi:hypothetical protein
MVRNRPAEIGPVPCHLRMGRMGMRGTAVKSIAERIAACGITVAHATELTGQVPVPEGWDPGTRSFTVTLHNADTGESLTVPWHIGPLSNSYPDRPDEVLDVLASEAAGVENADGFEDWAGEYGYDTDSRRAEATYRECCQEAERLRRFLGEQYQAFLFDTERL